MRENLVLKQTVTNSEKGYLENIQNPFSPLTLHLKVLLVLKFRLDISLPKEVYMKIEFLS